MYLITMRLVDSNLNMTLLSSRWLISWFLDFLPPSVCTYQLKVSQKIFFFFFCWFLKVKKKDFVPPTQFLEELLTILFAENRTIKRKYVLWACVLSPKSTLTSSDPKLIFSADSPSCACDKNSYLLFLTFVFQNIRSIVLYALEVYVFQQL